MADDERKAVGVDIGHDHALTPVYEFDGPRIYGYADAHRAADGKPCGGFAKVLGEGPGPSWTATGSLEDGTLTLDPSLLCRTCGDHGWVRDGRWVPA